MIFGGIQSILGVVDQLFVRILGRRSRGLGGVMIRMILDSRWSIPKNCLEILVNLLELLLLLFCNNVSLFLVYYFNFFFSIIKRGTDG
jgi:hypothetical protein